MTRKRADVTVTTTVAVDPGDAFAIFTDEVDLWWRRGPRYRFLGRRNGTLRFEAPRSFGEGVEGRLIEVADDGTSWEVGRVLAWEPGVRLAFEWRLPNFAPDERTEVEIHFEPTPEGTRVTVEHRGLLALRAGHPARHGMDDRAYAATIGRWWGALATSLREHTVAKRSE